MKVINIFGGPGVGKTTLAMEIFTMLNRQQKKIEYVPEYAKGLTWDESYKTMENQLKIFAEQHHWFYRIRNKVDTAVTDAPLFNSIVYSGKSEDNKLFHAYVFSEFNKYENLNIFLSRETEYKTHGRKQTIAEAIEIDEEVLRCLDYFDVRYVRVGLKNAAQNIISLL